MHKKFYNCRYDRPFKEIFLKEENKDLLKLLLEQVIDEKINNITYGNIERNNGNIHVRRKYLDGFVKADDKRIDIEINTVDVRVRNTAFTCNIYCTYTLVNDQYDENVKIIQINISYGLKYKKIRRTYKIQTDDKEEFVENFTIYEINMDRIMKLWYNKDEQEINKYKYFIMLALNKKDLQILAQEDEKVRKYMDELIKINKDPEFIRLVTKEEDERRIQNTLKRKAELQGEKRGEKNGIIKVARNLLKQKFDIKLISETTGLSIKELEKL